MQDTIVESAINSALEASANNNGIAVEITEERVSFLARLHKNNPGFHRAAQQWRGAMNYRERMAGRRALRSYIPDALEIIWLAVDSRRLARPFNPIHFDAQSERVAAIR